MNTRKAVADALREQQRRMSREDRLARLRVSPVISNLEIPDDTLMKAWETGLDSLSDDELVMSYFFRPDSGEPILTLTEIDAILQKAPDKINELLELVKALEIARRMSRVAMMLMRMLDSDPDLVNKFLGLAEVLEEFLAIAKSMQRMNRLADMVK